MRDSASTSQAAVQAFDEWVQKLRQLPEAERAEACAEKSSLDKQLSLWESCNFLNIFPKRDRLSIVKKFKNNFLFQFNELNGFIVASKVLIFMTLFDEDDYVTVIEILEAQFHTLLQDREFFHGFVRALSIQDELKLLEKYHPDYISNGERFRFYCLKYVGKDIRRAIYWHYKPKFQELIKSPVDLAAVLACTIELFWNEGHDSAASIIKNYGNVIKDAKDLSDLFYYSEKPEAVNTYCRIILDVYQDKIPEILSQSDDVSKVALIRILTRVTLLAEDVVEKVNKLLQKIFEEYPPYLQSPPQDSEGFAWLLENLPEKTLLKCVHHWRLKEEGFRFDAALMGPLPKWLAKFTDPAHREEFFLKLGTEDIRAGLKPEEEKKDFDCLLQVFKLLAPLPDALMRLMNTVQAEDFHFTFYELFEKIYTLPHVNVYKLLIWAHDILSSVQGSRRRDSYWQVVHDILTQPEFLKSSLQAVLNEFYSLLWLPFMVDQDLPAKHLKILLNDPRFNLYSRFRDGTTLEQYFELCEPEALRQGYLQALNEARKNQQRQGVYRLKFPRPEFRLSKDFYGENQPCMQDLSLLSCEDWFGQDPFTIGSEPKHRMIRLISVLKTLISENLHARLEVLQKNFENPEFFPGSDNRFYQLQALEAVVATAKALTPEQREAWLAREINQFSECPAGVLGALHHLILVNPLASASFVQEQYHLVEGIANTLTTRYLGETREGYDTEQGVHADVFPVRALCGLEPEKQIADPYYLSLIPFHIHRALAQEALYQLDQMGGIASFVARGSEEFKKTFGEEEITIQTPESNAEFNEKVARNLAPLGLAIEECFDYTDDKMTKLKLKADFEKVLENFLFEKGMIAYSATEAQRIKRQWGVFLLARPVQRFKEEFLGVVQGLLKTPGGLGLLISGLLEVAQSEDFADFPVENLLVTLPEYGSNILEIIAAHPWLGPQLLAGRGFTSPQDLANGRDPTEAYAPNLRGFLEKFTEDQRSDFIHHLLFLPGGMRTALLFLSEDERWTGSVEGEPAFLDILNKLTQITQQQLMQFAAIDYSGSLMSYLYEYGEGKPMLDSFVETFANPKELKGELALRHLLVLVTAYRNDEAEKLILENEQYGKALLDHFELGNIFSRQILASLTNANFRASLVAKTQEQGHPANVVDFWGLQARVSTVGSFSRGSHGEGEAPGTGVVLSKQGSGPA